MKFFISSTGYTIHPQDAGFTTIAEARKELRAVIKEEKQRAKNRWKKAVVIRYGKDSAAIHATKSEESPMWGRYTIIKN